MIYALSPDSKGDLRGIFALQWGLRIDQVRLKVLKASGICEIAALIQGKLPVLISTDPEHWSDEDS
jgi:hypothetical protein